MQKIEGKQIYLRPITMEDTDRIVSWRNQIASGIILSIRSFLQKKAMKIGCTPRWKPAMSYSLLSVKKITIDR